MRRITCIALLACVVSLGSMPVLARGGGGHGGGGGGGRGGGPHGGAHHGPGHAGFVHGFNKHGAFFVGGVCRNCGYFWPNDPVWEEYLDRVGSTPGPNDLTEEDLDAAQSDDRWPRTPSAVEREAQYRYDHRIND